MINCPLHLNNALNGFTAFSWLLPALLIPVAAYAEIHFRFPFLPSLVNKKEPEILFDLPLRAKTGTEVPLFLMVKDAQIHPIYFGKISVSVKADGVKKKLTKSWRFENQLNKRFFSHQIFLPAEWFRNSGKYEIKAKLEYKNSRGQKRQLMQDNYPRLKKVPFEIRISDEPLPSAPGWYWGDLHVHSNYTDDQVEFGASIADTISAARTAGLKFLAITDHSYDLDDLPDDYLKPDIKLTKWRRFHEEVNRVRADNPDMQIIPGEEVSAGNQRGQNVHCLVLNDPVFHPGSGDSAEKLFRNQPTKSLTDLLEQISAEAITLAAHPVEQPPLSQKLILRRGIWNANDCRHPRLTTLQILNKLDKKTLQAGLTLWSSLLLEGQKIGIAAGNDAHGNFNCFRQIALPFIKLVHHRNHLLGQMVTAVRANTFSSVDILQALRNHQSVISSGPLAYFEVPGNPPAGVGSTVAESPAEIRVFANSTPVYGDWQKFRIITGHFKRQEEIVSVVSPATPGLRVEQILTLPEPDADYIRLEAFTMDQFCITNPIWIRKKESS